MTKSKIHTVFLCKRIILAAKWNYVDSDYSNSYFLRKDVNDGYYIENVRTLAAKEGYTFVGWYIGVYGEDGNLVGYGESFESRNDTVGVKLCNTTGMVLGSSYKMR